MAIAEASQPYQLLPDETGEQYAERLRTIKNPHKGALMAAHVIADAMKLDFYVPEGRPDRPDVTNDNITKAFDGVAKALGNFDRMKSIAESNFVQNQVKGLADIKIAGKGMGNMGMHSAANASARAIKSKLEGLTNQPINALGSELSVVWLALKEASGFKKEDPNKDVVKSFYDDNGKPSLASGLVENLLTARNVCAEASIGSSVKAKR